MIVVLAVCVALAAGQTLYISPFGSPTNSGLSPSSPLQTLIEAVNAITQPSATIIAASGKYRWQQAITVQFASLNISCASATPHACQFSSPTLPTCLTVQATSSSPAVTVSLANVDVDGCNIFAYVTASLGGTSSSLVVSGGTASNTLLVYQLAAVPGTVSLQVDGVEFVGVAQAVQADTYSQYGHAQITAELSNIDVRNLTINGPFFAARADANAFVNVSLTEFYVRQSSFGSSFMSLSGAFCTLDTVGFKNVSFGYTLLALGVQSSISNLAVDGAICLGTGGAILMAEGDGTVTADGVTVTNTNAAALNVTADASFAISNAKFAGINVLRQIDGNETLGGAFACMDGQLSLASVLIQGCTAQTAAAGFCAPACQPDFQAVTVRLNKQNSSAGACIF